MVAVMGPSGAGKSTLVCLASLLGLDKNVHNITFALPYWLRPAPTFYFTVAVLAVYIQAVYMTDSTCL